MPGKNLGPDNNLPIRDDDDGVATTDGKHMQTETEIDMEAQREKRLADVIKLSEKQEEMLVLLVMLERIEYGVVWNFLFGIVVCTRLPQKKLTDLLAIRDKTILNYKVHCFNETDNFIIQAVFVQL